MGNDDVEIIPLDYRAMGTVQLDGVRADDGNNLITWFDIVQEGSPVIAGIEPHSIPIPRPNAEKTFQKNPSVRKEREFGKCLEAGIGLVDLWSLAAWEQTHDGVRDVPRAN